MLIRSLPFLVVALAAMAPAQTVPTVLPAPSDLLARFHVRVGAVQNLSLPVTVAAPFEVRLVLAGEVRTLALAPHDVRAPGFQLLADDGRRLHRLPTPASVTYRGDVRGQAGSEVAAALADGQLSATIHLADGTLWAVQPLAAVDAALPRECHLVYRDADVIRPRGGCGVAVHARDVGAGHGHAPTAMKVCEIAIDADLAYYNRFGSNTTNVQNQVTSVMNSVGLIYRRDVEIDYAITTIIVRTTPIYTWNGTLNSLLTQFQNHWNANHGGVNRDVAHLFTGEGNFSGTIGLAFVGAICESFGYGVSMAYDGNLATNTGLVAHELGHNWNANHCDATPPCNVMCSGIGGCSGNITQFDAGTVSTIVAFKNTRTCLSDPGGGGQWTEVADAEPIASRAQAPQGSGALATISGSVAHSGDVDMYLIRIVDEASFSASTVGASPTLADTQLFLMDALGHGVVCNDDGAGAGTRSILDSTRVTANGDYYLAISGYDCDVTNNGNLVFASTATGQVPPNAGVGPVNGQSTGTSPTGTYTIVLTGCEFVPPRHTELGDAGDRLHTAQAPCKSGPLATITGNNGGGDVDLYRIMVDNPAAFSAATCSGAGFDTQLFLFDSLGHGVAGNDDACAAQSRIDSTLVTSAGLYYLAVSRYDRDPVSLGGLIFPNGATGQNGPTGPGGTLPLAGWTGSTVGGGAYTVTLTGCSHAAASLIRLYGTGSGSAAGVPGLSTRFHTQLGNQCELTVNNPDATAAGMALVLGLSRTSIPLLNGTLYVGDMMTVLSLPAPAVGNSSIGPFTLSRVPSLCGAQVTWQAVIVVAPTANFPTGLTWTNGVEWTFGL